MSGIARSRHSCLQSTCRVPIPAHTLMQDSEMGHALKGKTYYQIYRVSTKVGEYNTGRKEGSVEAEASSGSCVSLLLK